MKPTILFLLLLTVCQLTAQQPPELINLARLETTKVLTKDPYGGSEIDNHPYGIQNMFDADEDPPYTYWISSFDSIKWVNVEFGNICQIDKIVIKLIRGEHWRPDLPESLRMLSYVKSEIQSDVTFHKIDTTVFEINVNPIESERVLFAFKHRTGRIKIQEIEIYGYQQDNDLKMGYPIIDTDKEKVVAIENFLTGKTESEIYTDDYYWQAIHDSLGIIYQKYDFLKKGKPDFDRAIQTRNETNLNLIFYRFYHQEKIENPKLIELAYYLLDFPSLKVIEDAIRFLYINYRQIDHAERFKELSHFKDTFQLSTMELDKYVSEQFTLGLLRGAHISEKLAALKMNGFEDNFKALLADNNVYVRFTGAKCLAMMGNHSGLPEAQKMIKEEIRSLKKKNQVINGIYPVWACELLVRQRKKDGARYMKKLRRSYKKTLDKLDRSTIDPNIPIYFDACKFLSRKLLEDMTDLTPKEISLLKHIVDAP